LRVKIKGINMKKKIINFIKQTFFPAMLILISMGLLTDSIAQQSEWRAVDGPLETPWTDQVDPENVLPEYPRPMLERESWKNLNGLWDYTITDRNAPRPVDFDGNILVPFAIQSSLSGVGKEVDQYDRLWYRRTFEVPADWGSDRIQLNFGAVDWEAVVWVNGRYVGEHRGGYDPFSFDITGALNSDGPQEIIVAVWDPVDEGYNSRGKQVHDPGGIWYTAVTGIWQTVWLEPVADQYAKNLRITPDIDRSVVTIETELGTYDAAELNFTVTDNGATVTQGTARATRGLSEITLDIPDAKLWSPDSPHLYGLELQVVQDGQVVDEVGSYFGMRKISLGKDENGITRIMFNNEFLFQYGFLDQGYWPDGLYTAPTDEALRYDIEVTKEMGFNMARKHVKVEPARWYYWADKLGLLVWQDMPNGGEEHIRGDDPDEDRVAQSAMQFDREYLSVINAFYNHPSIVMWVPFNEGWGQFDTERIVDLTREHDPTRLVNNTSGWTDRGVGDVHDIHSYPGPDAPEAEEDRAIVLGEYGGPGLMIDGHMWQEEDVWGHHQTLTTRDELKEAYLDLVTKLRPLIDEPGLSAAVFTQTTDVEVEVNGFMTYDRRVIKLDVDWLRELHETLY
jgi:beta-galactosidase/beta-glucuronidase